MPTLRIPNSELVVVRTIADLEESIFVAFVKAIEETDTKYLAVDFSETLAPKIPALKVSQMKPILRTALSLYNIMTSRNRSPEELGNDLKETIEITDPNIFPHDKASILRDRIQKLLSIGKVMALAAKTLDVMTDQDKIFCAVKVLSDIRPVFQDSTDAVSAAVVIHNLRIGYHQDGEHREFSVAMSLEDVRKVKEAMERAERKSYTLKAFVQNSGITYFEDKG